MAVNCNLQSLLQNSRCFLDQCNSDAEREAMQIFIRVRTLGAAGGTQYSLQSLLTAAKGWQALSEKQISAIETYISQANAIENGAALNISIGELKALSECYLCLPTMIRKQLLLFLNCALGEQNVAG